MIFDILKEYLKDTTNTYQPHDNQRLSLFLQTIFYGLSVVCILFAIYSYRKRPIVNENQNLQPRLEDEDESAEESEELGEGVEEYMQQDSLNERILASVGMTPDMIRDHALLREFIDFTTLELTDDPVVLNTGEIVNQESALKLIEAHAKLPRGEVVSFFKSPPLKSILNELVEDEVRKFTNRKVNLI